MKVTALLAVLTLTAAAQTPLEETLRKGILEEETKQNLNAAIQAYESVLNQFDSARKTAATALFRIAESYRKLGRNDQAIAAYNRLLREFPDQTRLAEQSRHHLTETYKVRQTRIPGSVPEENEAEFNRTYRTLIEQQFKVVEEQLRDMEKKVELGVLDPQSQEMLGVKMQVLSLRRELARIGPPQQ